MSVVTQIWVASLMFLNTFSLVPVAAQLSQQDVGRLSFRPADHRIAYGPDALQFGDLRLPMGSGPHPLAIIVHGGCWLAAFADLQLMSPLSDALTQAGIATWNIEFRSVDQAGGGWPNTLLDVASAVDYSRDLAAQHPINLERVVIVGHSAGGHLAQWAAARHRLTQDSPLFRKNPLPVIGTVGLASINDLQRYLQESASCGQSIPRLLGGSPTDVPERYRDASPAEMLPLGGKQVLIIGAQDTIVKPQHNRTFAGTAQKRGDDVQLIVLDNAGHFDVIAPTSRDWPTIEAAVLSIVNSVKK
ncbi:MAG TPA: alpha/beta fold hydrolase [Burkholderiaceae bacterium]|nr:alpha/beta fold hydrolase [Burkholderiaceae bacterium]